MTERKVWLTDRFGVEQEVPETTGVLFTLLDSLIDADEEHNSVSFTDSDGWNLEFTEGWVAFENVEEGGQEVGRLSWRRNPLIALQVISEFIIGDFQALRARNWT